MMKLMGTLRGRKTLVLGLSHANLDRLRRDGLDGSIRIDCKDQGGPDLVVLITAAESEAMMFEEFSKNFDGETKVHVSEKLKQ